MQLHPPDSHRELAACCLMCAMNASPAKVHQSAQQLGEIVKADLGGQNTCKMLHLNLGMTESMTPKRCVTPPQAGHLDHIGVNNKAQQYHTIVWHSAQTSTYDAEMPVSY